MGQFKTSLLRLRPGTRGPTSDSLNVTDAEIARLEKERSTGVSMGLPD
jgi:hypothetical protein